MEDVTEGMGGVSMRLPTTYLPSSSACVEFSNRGQVDISYPPCHGRPRTYRGSKLLVICIIPSVLILGYDISPVQAGPAITPTLDRHQATDT